MHYKEAPLTNARIEVSSALSCPSLLEEVIGNSQSLLVSLRTITTYINVAPVSENMINYIKVDIRRHPRRYGGFGG